MIDLSLAGAARALQDRTRAVVRDRPTETRTWAIAGRALRSRAALEAST